MYMMLRNVIPKNEKLQRIIASGSIRWGHVLVHNAYSTMVYYLTLFLSCRRWSKQLIGFEFTFNNSLERLFFVNTNPDTALRSPIAHVSTRTEILYYAVFRYTATNCSDKEWR